MSLYEQAKKSTIGFSSVEGRMLLLAYNYQISHDWFISKLKYKCLADPVFFSDLLKRGYKNHWHWIEPILSATDSAPSVVIKEALKLVPNIEISDRQKRFLVKWLGNVQITD